MGSDAMDVYRIKRKPQLGQYACCAHVRAENLHCHAEHSHADSVETVSAHQPENGLEDAKFANWWNQTLEVRRVVNSPDHKDAADDHDDEAV